MQEYIQKLSILSCALLLSAPAAAVTIEELFAQPVVKEIKISPNGEHLAIKVFGDGAHSLVFMKRGTQDVVGGLKFRSPNEVGRFYWANNERIVAELYEVGLMTEAPRYYGELWAISIDKKKAEPIFGVRSADNRTGTILATKTADYDWAKIIDPLPQNKKEILISSTSYSQSQKRRSAAILLDTYSGRETERKHVSKYPNAIFLTDDTGKIRLATSRDEENKIHVEGLPVGVDKWIEFPQVNFGSYFTPVAIADDQASAYVLDNIGNDKIGLHKLTLDGKEYKEIYSHENVDITSVHVSTDNKGVYAIRVDDGRPSHLLLSRSYEEAKLFKNLLMTFPGRTVDISSRSDDGRFWVIYSSADVDAGSYYLFDKEKNSLLLLFKSQPGIDIEELSPVEPIEFESFDGLKITGYFTPAKRRNDETAPMVVLVHGGPRSRDYWKYDPEVQALATQGYSVLQINYRGSSGFGDSFMHAGDLHWGDWVQQDIIAGTRWAISDGKASEGHVCIMGTSFGAYSAVQSAALEPDLYACVIANAGIYDLELLFDSGDIEGRYGGKNYLEEVLGRDKKQLKQFSPVHNVASLEAPVLVAHGKQDQRAPYEHANRLKKALDDHDKSYELFTRTREAHGFYDTENQVDFMKEVLGFLEQHLQ